MFSKNLYFLFLSIDIFISYFLKIYFFKEYFIIAFDTKYFLSNTQLTSLTVIYQYFYI